MTSVSWQFNATACRLAATIYYARAEAFGLDVPAWDALAPSSRSLYVDQAQQILNANRPVESSSLLNAFIGMARQHAASVVPFAPKEAGRE